MPTSLRGKIKKNVGQRGRGNELVINLKGKKNNEQRR